MVFTWESQTSDTVVTAAGTTITAKFKFPMPRSLVLSLFIGFMIAALVFSVGSISGANINPAVTLALAITQKMSIFRACCYVAAQCLGSMVGASLVRSIAPKLFDFSGGGVNAVVKREGVGIWTVLGGEALATSILVLTVCAAADVGREKKNKYQGALTPLCIGLAVSSSHFLLMGLDGCSINPARSLGPAVARSDYTDLWVFWVGPMLGSLFAVLLYNIMFTGLGGWSGGEGGGALGEEDEGSWSARQRESAWDESSLGSKEVAGNKWDNIRSQSFVEGTDAFKNGTRGAQSEFTDGSLA